MTIAYKNGANETGAILVGRENGLSD